MRASGECNVDRVWRQGTSVALAVTAVLLLTVVAVTSLFTAERDENDQRLERAARDVATTASTELTRLSDLGEDLAVTLALVHGELDAGSYETLLRGFGLERRFPSLTGVSYVERVPRPQLEERLARREPGGPPLVLFDDTGEDPVRLLTMSYPRVTNQAALGVDLGSRPESRVAHDRAVARRAPTLANLTRIVQLPPDEPGVSVHIPVVVDEEVVATVGLVVSVPGFLRGLQPLPSGVEVAVLDPGSPAFPDPVRLASGPPADGRSATTTLALLGQEWELTVTANEAFETPWYRRGSSLLGLGGAVAALLVGLLVGSLATREQHASNLVSERTREVSMVNAQLLAANDQLGALNRDLAGTNLELADANRRLEIAGRDKDEFLAAVSHELRTPLTVIGGFLESLRRLQPSGQELVDMLDPIDRGFRRLDLMVGDLLTLVSLDAGAEVAHPEPVQLEAFLASAPAQLMSRDHGMVDVEVTGAPVASVDLEHLERIVANLLANAVQHGLPPVVLSAAEVGSGRVEITVRDHGPGIPAAEADVVFQRFARITGQRAVTGTGLGLAIVRELAELAGGAVTYTGAEPGARFTVLLPGLPAG